MHGPGRLPAVDGHRLRDRSRTPQRGGGRGGAGPEERLRGVVDVAGGRRLQRRPHLHAGHGHGRLTQTGCISDDGGDGRPGSDGLCTDGDVLAGANAIAISPDGLNVYAAAAAQSGVAVFTRDPETGALTQTGCVKNYNDNDRCTQATGLRGVDAIDVSPDGKHVYAAARESDAVVAFARDAETGALTGIGCVSNTGHDGACTDATALDGASEIAVAPDGRSVYVTAGKVNAITVLSRDAETGVLAPQGCFMDAPPEGGACKRLDGIAGAGTMALSPDGASLYLASSSAGTLVTFKRDLESGALTPSGCQVNALPSGDDSVYQPEEEESPTRTSTRTRTRRSSTTRSTTAATPRPAPRRGRSPTSPRSSSRRTGAASSPPAAGR